jgi:hypothetical protein
MCGVTISLSRFDAKTGRSNVSTLFVHVPPHTGMLAFITRYTREFCRKRDILCCIELFPCGNYYAAQAKTDHFPEGLFQTSR